MKGVPWLNHSTVCIIMPHLYSRLCALDKNQNRISYVSFQTKANGYNEIFWWSDMCVCVCVMKCWSVKNIHSWIQLSIAAGIWNIFYTYNFITFKALKFHFTRPVNVKPRGITSIVTVLTLNILSGKQHMLFLSQVEPDFYPFGVWLHWQGKSCLWC